MSDERSAWAAGWAAFAGIILVMSGVFQMIAGLAAVIDDDFYVTTQNWVLQFDTTAWGWIHLIFGLVLLLSGIGIFSGNIAARTVGVIVAAIGGVIAFAWLPYYPIWAVILIAMNVSVIWALTAHGRDLAES